MTGLPITDYYQLLVKMCEQYSADELIENCKSLNRSYNLFDPAIIQWKKILLSFSKSDLILQELQKIAYPNQVINDLFLRNYQCERIIKYFLLKKLMGLKENIVAFEMCVGSSRIDICRINGHTYAYEIKTEYDSFKRLQTQLPTYRKYFDYVYVVTPLNRINDLIQNIPGDCGIIGYTIKKGVCRFSYKRRAQKNNCDIHLCIQSFSTLELTKFIKMMGSKKIPMHRVEKEIIATELGCKKNAWKIYRTILKERYVKKWNFIVENREKILPIDMQEFFSSTLSPEIFYQKK